MKRRIALEASSALSEKHSGVQRCIHELSKALATTVPEEWTLRLVYSWTRYAKRALRPDLPLEHRWELPLVGLGGYDLVHTLDTHLPGGRSRILVSTVHDVFSFVINDHGSPGFRRRKRSRYRRIARQARRVIVPSNSTRNDFITHTGARPEKVRVIPWGVGSSFCGAYVPGGGTGGKDYVLVFGGAQRKNLDTVLQAFALAGLPDTLRLKVVGRVGEAAASRTAELGLAHRVDFLGKVSEGAMPGLYAGAAMLCFASRYEGFGLPVLEAMAAGTPVVTGTGSATEEIGKSHAELVDPRSPRDIAGGMERAAHMSDEAILRAHEYARGFTWQRCAERILGVYRECLGE